MHCKSSSSQFTQERTNHYTGDFLYLFIHTFFVAERQRSTFEKHSATQKNVLIDQRNPNVRNSHPDGCRMFHLPYKLIAFERNSLVWRWNTPFTWSVQILDFCSRWTFSAVSSAVIHDPVKVFLMFLDFISDISKTNCFHSGNFTVSKLPVMQGFLNVACVTASHTLC